MKQCNRCKLTKPFSAFYTNGKQANGRQRYKPKCRSCEYEFDLDRLRTIIEEFYGGLKCQRCGYDKYAGSLECHHRDPSEKDIEVSNMRTSSKSRIETELAKCDLVCSNCHREVHAGLV